MAHAVINGFMRRMDFFIKWGLTFWLCANVTSYLPIQPSDQVVADLRAVDLVKQSWRAPLYSFTVTSFIACRPKLVGDLRDPRRFGLPGSRVAGHEIDGHGFVHAGQARNIRQLHQAAEKIPVARAVNRTANRDRQVLLHLSFIPAQPVIVRFSQAQNCLFPAEKAILSISLAGFWAQPKAHITLDKATPRYGGFFIAARAGKHDPGQSFGVCREIAPG